MGGATDHFSAVAADYARRRPDYPPEIAEWLAGLAPARELAWEAGCGSGQFTRLLAGRFARVVATDLSAAQIAEAPPLPGVDWRAAPAEVSGLRGARVDLAVAAQAAHWFDLPAFRAEVRRVLKPGGVVALVSYGVMDFAPPWGPTLARFYRETLAGLWPPERAHVEAGYRTLPFPFDEIAAPAFAIRRDWALDDLLGYVRTWSAVRGLERAGRGAELDALAVALAAAWGDPAAPRAMVWPVALRVARVGA
jgi:SAM-dependent methyltransferase